MTLVIGHQGAPRSATANTAAAFAAAAAMGADGVELDVRRVAGGRVTVCHDAHLPDGRPLAGLRPEELPDGMCDLDAALDACAGLRVVNVEIKNSPVDPDYDPGLAIADTVAGILMARSAEERERYLVSCFDLATVDRVRAVAPGLATAWLMLGFSEVAADVARAAEGGHRALHPHHGSVDAEVVGQVHDAGLQLNTWTCDDPERIRWLAGAGVDGIVTNVPDVALAALGR